MLGLAGQTNSLSEAGGIGALLATFDFGDVNSGGDEKSYAHVYDGNGNTGQLMQVNNNTLAAAYEYDADGQVESETGPYAATNRMRFSTKPFDSETGLGLSLCCGSSTTNVTASLASPDHLRGNCILSFETEAC